MAGPQRSRNPGNFAEDREKASRAGQIGGQHSSGNFANNPERAAEAGRKGGQNSHGGGGGEKAAPAGQTDSQHGNGGPAKTQASAGGAEPDAGSFAQDREKAAAAGRKGGSH